jgi:uncharacterized integral membrane protein
MIDSGADSPSDDTSGTGLRPGANSGTGLRPDGNSGAGLLPEDNSGTGLLPEADSGADVGTGQAEAEAEAEAEDPRDVAARALRRSLRHPFQIGFVLGGLVAMAAALLIIQNGQTARINWLWFDFTARLWVVLLTTLIAGALVWETIRLFARRTRRLRRERREALAALRDVRSTGGQPTL